MKLLLDVPTVLRAILAQFDGLTANGAPMPDIELVQIRLPDRTVHTLFERAPVPPTFQNGANLV